jgi:hypothetical protein
MIVILDYTSNGGGNLDKKINAEGTADREKVDSKNVERPMPEFGPCGTIGRSIRNTLNGVPNNVISTLIDYDQRDRGLEAVAIEIALRTGGLAYSEKGPFTCFVPTERAFTMLSYEDIDSLFGDDKKLLETLKSHTARGKILYKDIKKEAAIKNLANKDLKIDLSGEGKCHGPKILYPDIMAGNGIIHIIDAVVTE